MLQTPRADGSIPTLALLGCGRMGSALALGLLRREPDIVVRAFDTAPASMDALAEAARSCGLGDRVRCCAHAHELVHGAELLVVAVKPKQLEAALRAVPLDSSVAVLSIAAGVSRACLQGWVRHPRVLRAMPNTPALVGEGISVLHVPSDVEPALLLLARRVLAALGEFVEVADEDLLHVVTALSGSGPAYAAVVLESLADGAVTEGLPRALALQLARETLRGAMTLMRDTHPALLKDAVSSPGGTTTAGLAAAEAGGLRSALIEAVRAATRRSRELG